MDNLLVVKGLYFVITTYLFFYEMGISFINMPATRFSFEVVAATLFQSLLCCFGGVIRRFVSCLPCCPRFQGGNDQAADSCIRPAPYVPARRDHSQEVDVPQSNIVTHSTSFFPKTREEWNDLPAH